MLSFVPYTFELYRTLPRYLRDSAAAMVSIANQAGVCWWSVRTFARITGISKSTASRHLELLTSKAFGFANRRRVGRSYEYTIDRKFLPRGAMSHGRIPDVPRARPKEQVAKKTGFASQNYEVLGENWGPRMRGWHHPQAGRPPFWQAIWGPRPGEPGCRVPQEYL